MNKENDKGLDDLFKKKLEDPVDQTVYKEEDWANLEQMLDKHKKRKGIIYLLPVISSIAALLLLFLGWWNFRPQVVRHNPKNALQAINHQKQTHTGTGDGPSRQPNNKKSTQTKNADYAVNTSTNKDNRKSKSILKLSAVGSRRISTGPIQTVITDKDNRNDDEVLLAESPVPVFAPEQITTQPVTLIYLQNKNADADINSGVSKNVKIKAGQQAAFRPRFALSVLAAPDINGVGSFQESKVGTNVGLLFSAGLSKKFTISTGVLYSDKPYLTAFENYHTPYQFPVNPVNVAANCQMLDIPVNIGYQVYNKHQNKISIGTGLSSYIMLHQSFTFNYADPYNTGPSNFNVPNSSGYFFGVLNLNATYERQLNSKVGISFQPYLKLPLTNIGYSQVRLQTTGVAVGLTWNLNSLSKP
jgi:hypothetical protein